MQLSVSKILNSGSNQPTNGQGPETLPVAPSGTPELLENMSPVKKQPGMPPPPPAATGDSAFQIGQRVEAKHKGKSKWHAAKIIGLNSDDGSFRVEYDSAMWNSWVPVDEERVNNE